MHTRTHTHTHTLLVLLLQQTLHLVDHTCTPSLLYTEGAHLGWIVDYWIFSILFFSFNPRSKWVSTVFPLCSAMYVCMCPAVVSQNSNYELNWVPCCAYSDINRVHCLKWDVWGLWCKLWERNTYIRTCTLVSYAYVHTYIRTYGFMCGAFPT